jgi:hypothetical protein
MSKPKKKKLSTKRDNLKSLLFANLPREKIKAIRKLELVPKN